MVDEEPSTCSTPPVAPIVYRPTSEQSTPEPPSS
jgi:hypothetical protein